MSSGPVVRTVDGGPVLLWRYPAPRLVLSSASVGGGLGERSWVVNIEVSKDYARTDLADHVATVAGRLDLEGAGVGLLTAARVDRFATAFEDDVVAVATVGLSVPTWASASPTAVIDEVGTINIVVDLPVRATASMLVNLVVTATEAKSQALLEAGVDGTGTASDAIVVSCPTTGVAEDFGGPRSRWGSVVARVVHDAVAARAGGDA